MVLLLNKATYLSILEAASIYKAMQQNRKLSVLKEPVCICDFEVI